MGFVQCFRSRFDSWYTKIPLHAFIHVVLRLFGMKTVAPTAALTAGLVQDAVHSVLPSVSPSVTALCTVLAMMVCWKN